MRRGRSGQTMLVWLTVIGLVTAAAEAAKPEGPVTGLIEPNRICMLNSFVVKLKGGGVPYVYKGKTYYFCCGGCIMRFSANPEVLRKAKDPVNDKEVDRATALHFALQDTVYYFSSAGTMKQFSEDPDKYLNKDNKKEEKKTEQGGKPSAPQRANAEAGEPIAAGAESKRD